MRIYPFEISIQNQQDIVTRNQLNVIIHHYPDLLDSIPLVDCALFGIHWIAENINLPQMSQQIKNLKRERDQLIVRQFQHFQS